MTVEEALADRLAWMSASRAAEAVGQRTAPERPADRLVPRHGRFKGYFSGTSGRSPAKVPPTVSIEEMAGS